MTILSFGNQNNINHTLERKISESIYSFYIDIEGTATCLQSPFFACRHTQRTYKNDSFTENTVKLLIIF